MNPPIGKMLPKLLKYERTSRPAWQEVEQLDLAQAMPEFGEKYVNPGKPVLVKGAVRNWPAVGEWSPEHIARKGAGLMLPVKSPAIREGKTRSVKLGDYVRGLRAYEAALERGEARAGTYPYLHDVPLFAHLPGLAHEVRPFPYGLFPAWYHKDILRFAQFFMSATGSVTPLHFDTLCTHNLFFQVHGVKEFFLLSPDQAGYCYRDGWRWFEVSASRPDLDKFPLFRQARLAKVRVEAGDVLFIPSGTLHEVVTLSASVSFNIDWHCRRSVRKGVLSVGEGAPLKNLWYNLLLFAGTYAGVPADVIFPFYQSYLSYRS